MIVVDVETGGINPQSSALLSIGAVEYENQDNHFYVEIDPIKGQEMNPKALEINDYNPDTWKNVWLSDAMVQFREWIEKIDGTRILAGHNPAFDRDFCNANFEFTDNPFRFQHRTIDLHTLGMMKFGKSYSANSIYEKLGMEKEPDPHNALRGAIWEAKAIKLLLVYH